MKFFISACALIFCFCTHAQRTIDVGKNDVNISNVFYTVAGEPFLNMKFVRLTEGSPYFNEEWMKGVIVGENGQEYKNLSLKLDLYDNEIHFLDRDGKEMLTTIPVREVILTEAGNTNYKFVHFSIPEKNGNVIKDAWYLWLCSGKAILYKEFKKTLTENKPYGSATTEQRINTKENYLVFYNNNFLEIKKLKDAPNVLANKKTELEDFLKNKDNSLLSMDDRFTALIEYYNSLFAPVK